MKPIAAMLKQLSSLLKTDAPSGRATGAPFARWDRSHFERWTQAPAKTAYSGRRETVRESLQARASQTQAMYFR